MSSGSGKVAESRASEFNSGKDSLKNKHNGSQGFNKAISKPMLAYGDSGASLFRSKTKLKVSPRGSIVGKTSSMASVSDSEGMASWLMSARETRSGDDSYTGMKKKQRSIRSMKISTVEVDALL